MIHININTYQFISFVLGFLYFQFISFILDRKTKYDDNQPLKLKYDILFVFLNIFCFLFIDKIKEYRKMDFLKDKISEREKLIGKYGSHIISESELEEHIQMKRYVNIKKMKSRIKWKRLKETVN